MIQKFKFGFIQFNKIFIQLENQGIEDHYVHPFAWWLCLELQTCASCVHCVIEISTDQTKEKLMFYLGIYLYVWVQLCFSSVSVFVCISSEGSAVYTWEDKLFTQRAHIVVSCARLPCTESSNLILMKYLSFCNFHYSQNTFYYFDNSDKSWGWDNLTHKS